MKTFFLVLIIPCVFYIVSTSFFKSPKDDNAREHPLQKVDSVRTSDKMKETEPSQPIWLDQKNSLQSQESYRPDIVKPGC